MSDDLEPWPEKVYLLHPSIKSFGDMVTNPERREYVLADRIEKLQAACWRMQQERDWQYDENVHRIYEQAKADRIAEAAEAKLAKTLEALHGVVDYYDKVNPFRTADYHGEGCTCDRCDFYRVRAVLAELEKQDD